MSALSASYFPPSNRRRCVKGRPSYNESTDSFISSIPVDDDNSERNFSNTDYSFINNNDPDDAEDEPITIDLSAFLNENPLLAESAFESSAEHNAAAVESNSQFRVTDCEVKSSEVNNDEIKTDTFTETSSVSISPLKKDKDELNLHTNIVSSECLTDTLHDSNSCYSAKENNAESTNVESSSPSVHILKNILDQENILDEKKIKKFSRSKPLGLSNPLKKYKNFMKKDIQKTNLKVFGKYPIVKCEKLDIESLVKNNKIKVSNWPLFNGNTGSKSEVCVSKQVCRKLNSIKSAIKSKPFKKPVCFKKVSDKRSPKKSHSILIDSVDVMSNPIVIKTDFWKPEITKISTPITNFLKSPVKTAAFPKIILNSLSRHNIVSNDISNSNSIMSFEKNPIVKRKGPIITSVNKVFDSPKIFPLIAPKPVVESKDILTTSTILKPVIETVTEPLLNEYTVIEPYVEDPLSPVKPQPILTVPIEIIPPPLKTDALDEAVIQNIEVTQNLEKSPKSVKSVFLNGTAKQLSSHNRSRKDSARRNLYRSKNANNSSFDKEEEKQSNIGAKNVVVDAMHSACLSLLKSKKPNIKQRQTKKDSTSLSNLFSNFSYNSILNDFSVYETEFGDSLNSTSNDLCDNKVKRKFKNMHKNINVTSEKLNRNRGFVVASPDTSETLSAPECENEMNRLNNEKFVLKKGTRKNDPIENAKPFETADIFESPVADTTSSTASVVNSKNNKGIEKGKTGEISISSTTSDSFCSVPDVSKDVQCYQDSPIQNSDLSEVSINNVSPVVDSDKVESKRTLRERRTDKTFFDIDKTLDDSHISSEQQDKISKSIKGTINMKLKVQMKTPPRSTAKVKIKKPSKPEDIIREIKTITGSLRGRPRKQKVLPSESEEISSGSSSSDDSESNNTIVPSENQKTSSPREYTKKKTLKVLFKRSRKNSSSFKTVSNSLSDSSENFSSIKKNTRYRGRRKHILDAVSLNDMKDQESKIESISVSEEKSQNLELDYSSLSSSKQDTSMNLKTSELSSVDDTEISLNLEQSENSNLEKNVLKHKSEIIETVTNAVSPNDFLQETSNSDAVIKAEFVKSKASENASLEKREESVQEKEFDGNTSTLSVSDLEENAVTSLMNLSIDSFLCDVAPEEYTEASAVNDTVATSNPDTNAQSYDLKSHDAMTNTLTGVNDSNALVVVSPNSILDKEVIVPAADPECLNSHSVSNTNYFVESSECKAVIDAISEVHTDTINSLVASHVSDSLGVKNGNENSDISNAFDDALECHVKAVTETVNELESNKDSEMPKVFEDLEVLQGVKENMQNILDVSEVNNDVKISAFNDEAEISSASVSDINCMESTESKSNKNGYIDMVSDSNKIFTNDVLETHISDKKQSSEINYGVIDHCESLKTVDMHTGSESVIESEIKNSALERDITSTFIKLVKDFVFVATSNRECILENGRNSIVYSNKDEAVNESDSNFNHEESEKSHDNSVNEEPATVDDKFQNKNSENTSHEISDSIELDYNSDLQESDILNKSNSLQLSTKSYSREINETEDKIHCISNSTKIFLNQLLDMVDNSMLQNQMTIIDNHAEKEVSAIEKSPGKKRNPRSSTPSKKCPKIRISVLKNDESPDSLKSWYVSEKRNSTDSFESVDSLLASNDFSQNMTDSDLHGQTPLRENGFDSTKEQFNSPYTKLDRKSISNFDDLDGRCNTSSHTETLSPDNEKLLNSNSEKLTNLEIKSSEILTKSIKKAHGRPPKIRVGLFKPRKYKKSHLSVEHEKVDDKLQHRNNNNKKSKHLSAEMGLHKNGSNSSHQENITERTKSQKSTVQDHNTIPSPKENQTPKKRGRPRKLKQENLENKNEVTETPGKVINSYHIIETENTSGFEKTHIFQRDINERSENYQKSTIEDDGKNNKFSSKNNQTPKKRGRPRKCIQDNLENVNERIHEEKTSYSIETEENSHIYHSNNDKLTISSKNNISNSDEIKEYSSNINQSSKKQGRYKKITIDNPKNDQRPEIDVVNTSCDSFGNEKKPGRPRKFPFDNQVNDEKTEIDVVNTSCGSFGNEEKKQGRTSKFILNNHDNDDTTEIDVVNTSCDSFKNEDKSEENVNEKRGIHEIKSCNINTNAKQNYSFMYNLKKGKFGKPRKSIQNNDVNDDNDSINESAVKVSDETCTNSYSINAEDQKEIPNFDTKGDFNAEDTKLESKQDKSNSKTTSSVAIIDSIKNGIVGSIEFHKENDSERYESRKKTNSRNENSCIKGKICSKQSRGKDLGKENYSNIKEILKTDIFEITKYDTDSTKNKVEFHKENIDNKHNRIEATKSNGENGEAKSPATPIYKGKRTMKSTSTPTPPVSSCKERKRNYDPELVCIPFTMGWMREHVIRKGSENSGPKRNSDVYYFAPDGTKLRSMPEILSYLSKHTDSELTKENFTFAKELIYREPFEIERNASDAKKSTPVSKKCVSKGSGSKNKTDTTVLQKKKNGTSRKNSSPEKNSSLAEVSPRPKRNISQRAGSTEAVFSVAEPKQKKIKEYFPVDKNSSMDIDEDKRNSSPDNKIGKVRPKRSIKRKLVADDIGLPAQKYKVRSRVNLNPDVTFSNNSYENVKDEPVIHVKKESPSTSDSPVPIKINETVVPDSSVLNLETTRDKPVFSNSSLSNSTLFSYLNKRTTQSTNRIKSREDKINCHLYKPCSFRCKTISYPSIQCAICYCLFHQDCVRVKPTARNLYACLGCVYGKFWPRKDEDLVNSEMSSSDDISLSVTSVSSSLTSSSGLPVSSSAFSFQALHAKDDSPSSFTAASNILLLTVDENSGQCNSDRSDSPVNAGYVYPEVLLVEKGNVSKNVQPTKYKPISPAIPSSSKISSSCSESSTSNSCSTSKLPIITSVRSFNSTSTSKLPIITSIHSSNSSSTSKLPIITSVRSLSKFPYPDNMTDSQMFSAFSNLSASSNIMYFPTQANIKQTLNNPLYYPASVPLRQLSSLVYGAPRPVTMPEPKRFAYAPMPKKEIYTVKAINVTPVVRSNLNYSKNVGNLAVRSNFSSTGTICYLNPHTITSGASYTPQSNVTSIAHNVIKNSNELDSVNSLCSSETETSKLISSKNLAGKENVSLTKKNAEQETGTFKVEKCLGLIFKYLNLYDLLCVSQVCQSWKLLASEPSLWENVCFANLYVTDWEKCCLSLQKYRTKVLNFHGIAGLKSIEDWLHVVECLQYLTSIEELIFETVPPFVINSVAERMLSLKHLSCQCVTPLMPENDSSTQCEFDLGVLRHISSLENLRIGSIGGILLSSSNFSLMPYLPRLTHVALTGFKFSSHMSLECLSQQKMLVSLELGDCMDIEPQIYKILRKLTQIRYLRLENGGDSFDSQLPKAICNMKSLQELELMNFKIPQTLSAVLKELKSLEKISMWPNCSTDCALVNFNAYEAVTSCSNLKKICWGVITEDEVPNVLELRDPDQNENTDNSRLSFEELFRSLVERFPGSSVDIKCVPKELWSEFCNTRN